MNEQECRNLIKQVSDEKIQPLVIKMAEIIADAYRYGVETGMLIGKNIKDNNKNEQSS